MNPIQASKKLTEKEVYSNFQDKQLQPDYKLRGFVRTADFKKVLSKGDSTNYSFNCYTETKVIHDTIPSYRVNYLPERYNQTFLKPAKITLEENN